MCQGWFPNSKYDSKEDIVKWIKMAKIKIVIYNLRTSNNNLTTHLVKILTHLVWKYFASTVCFPTTDNKKNRRQQKLVRKWSGYLHVIFLLRIRWAKFANLLVRSKQLVLATI